MPTEPSLWSFIANADIIVKTVILILTLASIVSWTIILQRRRLIQTTKKAATLFEDFFWSGISLDDALSQKRHEGGLDSILKAGFKELEKSKKSNMNQAAILDNCQRAMRVASAQELQKLSTELGLLATIGSTSPYIGLFGTVWGIMSAFRTLGGVQQATISMVAPGIAEALIATAFGLFAAIPAVIAYNRYTNEVAVLEERFAIFQEELTNMLHREIYA